MSRAAASGSGVSPRPSTSATRLTLDEPIASATTSREERDAEYRRHFRATYDELARRLNAEPGVASVTYATRLPGMNHIDMRVEVDGAAHLPNGEGAPYIRTTPVGVNFFETFQAPIVAGRSFNEGDLAPGRNVAIVDLTFVRHVLNGQPALGRYVRDPGGATTAAGSMAGDRRRRH